MTQSQTTDGVPFPTVLEVRDARHAQAVGLEALVIGNEAAAIREQELYAVRTLPDEHEEVSRVEVLPTESTHKRREPIVSATQSHGLGGDEDAHAALVACSRSIPQPETQSENRRQQTFRRDQLVEEHKRRQLL